jgi:hypothetical protein
MPVNIRYPNQTPLVDASGLIGGISDLGDRFQQNRLDKKNLAEAERLFGRMSGPNSGGNPTQQQPMSLAALAPQQQEVTRAPLPAVDSASVRQQAAGNIDSGNGGSVFGRFMKAVQGGGLTNGAALAAVAATGSRESGFKPENASGTWSDPSESGRPGTAGGIMSWRGPRLQALQAFAGQNGDDPNAPSPETQGKFLLQENPQLIAQLQQAKTPQEAQQLMNAAWRYAGHDQPGGETAARMAEVEKFAPQFGGSSQSPSQSALEGLAVGESMPMGGGAAQPAQGFQPISTGGFGLDPKTMAAALQNPITRPFAIEMAKARMSAMSDERDPMKKLAYEKAVLELEQLRRGDAKPTDDMREFVYSQQNPEFAQYQLDQKRASSTQVNVGSEKGFDKTVGEGYGKRFMDMQDGAQTAQRAINALDVMEQAMADPGFYSGAGAGTVNNLKRFGRALGMDVEGIADAESFNAMSKQAALDSMGGSLGSGFSNADRDFVLDQVPNLQNTPEGNARLIDIQRKMNTRRQQIAQHAREYAAQNGGRIDAGFDDALAQWSEANPLFPAQPAGSGANRGAGGANGRARARNPQTGAEIEWDGTKWSPVR